MAPRRRRAIAVESGMLGSMKIVVDGVGD